MCVSEFHSKTYNKIPSSVEKRIKKFIFAIINVQSDDDLQWILYLYEFS